ncbi:MAG: hypothetical protein ACOYOF_11815 [Verrucomicrobiaceae bacterium]|jgi:hypothetical protein
MSNTPTKKTAKIASGLTGLTSLPSDLRAIADLIESLGPLLNASTLKTAWKQLSDAAARFDNLTAEDFLASKDDYLACRRGWLEAWSKKPESVERFCVRVLGKSKSNAAKPGEDSVTRALRLLPLCISAAGREDVLRETQAALAPTEPAPQSKPHIGDGAARDALHKWGEMSEPEFLAFAIDVPMDLLTRAAALLGINMSSRAATGLKKIHKAATRFHRNTRT